MALSTAAIRSALLLAPMAAHKGRLALSVAAIALGVALGYAVQLINKAAVSEMAQAMRALSGTADVIVHGPRSGFSEEWYMRIAGLPEVEEASPVVEVEAKVSGRDQALRILGLDIFRAARIQPELALAEGGEALDFLRPGRLFLSRSAAEWLVREPGDGLQLQSGMRQLDFTVAGVLSAGALRERLAVMDIAAVQDAFERNGIVSQVQVKLKGGTQSDAFAARLRAQLPMGMLVERPEAAVQRNANLTRAYRINLNVLALVALFTGALLVFSTQMLAVVRRRPEIALLRALGVTRIGVLRQLLYEATLTGAAGAVIGLLAGHGSAAWALAHYGADLGAGHFRGIEAAARIDVGALVLFGLLGIAASAAGTWFAALEAARADPATALRAGDEQQAFVRLNRAWPGVTLLAVGVLLALAPPVAGLPIAGYLSIVLLLLGTLQLMPRLSREVFCRLPDAPAPAVQLALEQLRGAPGQTGVSLAAIVASVSLMASMAIMVFSFRQSFEHWLERMLPADLYVRAAAAGDTGFFPRDEERRIAAVPGVRRADFMRVEQVYVAPDRPRASLLIRDMDRENAGEVLALVSDPRPVRAGEPPPVWVSEAMVDLHGLRPGQAITLPIGEKSERFTVAGVWRDYARQHGAIVIERRTYGALGGDTRSTNAALWVAPDTPAESVASALRSALSDRAEMEISRPGEIREQSLRIFDRTFAVTYALEAVAVLIGLFALSSSFAALALARRREFGVLRHLGMTRRQIGAMLAFEGTLVSALGLVVGLALGWLLSLVLVHVINRQSFHWSMDVQLPWLSLAAFVAVMLPLASFTAWAGARRAMSGDAVQAVKDVW
ncbi:MAG: hypothetical protein A3I01_18865 [Betaproteobacteria bacterium RIFCSPLOWO2_02_FULL_65_24]|nr:MAG: hypothetical protein A3I01_18865 [Betaproteobacteria bacterium RIFCSPLOWO2_02_FULL_65_24]OGA73213.1 MAG: hypothetical protein A3G27_04240 [Betaproteobacteria bacterium RIFCSPLOWO2_12_FULL_66_14]